MKRFTLSKKWIFWGINGLLALLAAVCLLLEQSVCGALPTLGAAKSWAGESGERFAQLACYLPVDQRRSEEDVLQFRQTLGNKLTEAAMEAPENGSLYTDAYSAAATLTVTGDRGSAQVKIIGVGGDFFRFHPLALRSGSYLTEDDLMQDRVLLDEELAWKLFGGMELTGLSVTIGDADYYVAGVISREDDRYSTLAYTDGAGMFMSYSALHQLDETVGIDCYEIVLPDPITSYAANLVRESFPLGSGVLVENSSRYSISNLLAVAGDFGRRSMGTNGVLYPYWENAVRMTEDYAALLLVLAGLLALLPTVSLTVMAIRLLRRLWKRTAGAVRSRIGESVEKHREEVWQATEGKKEDHGEGTI